MSWHENQDSSSGRAPGWKSGGPMFESRFLIKFFSSDLIIKRLKILFFIYTEYCAVVDQNLGSHVLRSRRSVAMETSSECALLAKPPHSFTTTVRCGLFEVEGL